MSNTMSNDQHSNRVAGGYKATLNNPNASEEAKQRAREYLEGGNDTTENNDSEFVESGDSYANDSLSGNQIGGYKATLKNPNTSEEAKDKARQILEGNADPSDFSSSGSTGDEHSNRVLGGYKATLSNPNTGEEAKEHARQALREAGQDVE